MVVPAGQLDVQVANFEFVLSHAYHKVHGDSVATLEVLYETGVR